MVDQNETTGYQNGRIEFQEVGTGSEKFSSGHNDNFKPSTLYRVYKHCTF